MIYKPFMKMRKQFLYHLLCVSTLSSCVGTYGPDYYSNKAYKSLGIEGEQNNPSNVVQYIPGDPKAQEKIANAMPPEMQMSQQGMQNPQMGQNILPPEMQMSQQGMQNPQMGQNILPPEMQMSQQGNMQPQQPFILGNTSNYSQDLNPSRSINATNIRTDYYAEYLHALANHYLQYSNIFASKGLNSDAQLLHSKSDTAASGHDVVFETEHSFDLPLDKKSIVSQQRRTIENIKSRMEILKEIPTIIAQIQAGYDCMVLEARNRVYSQNTVCGLAYFQALNTIETRYGSMTVAHNVTPAMQSSGTEQPQLPIIEAQAQSVDVNEMVSATDVVPSSSETKATQPVKVAEPREAESHYVEHNTEFTDKAVLKYDNHKSFVAYYNIGSAELDETAIYAINKAIMFAKDYDDYKINVLGFADRISDRDFNKRLSEKRAAGVVEALIKRGISRDKVKKVIFGEDYGSVNTRDGIGESFNRRIVIEVDVSSTFDEDSFIMQKASENVVLR
jgi:outer membrane protein OmpA-like peptidoglycan-associated protein